MAGAIDVKQLAVASHTAPAPDVHPGLGIDFTRWQLDRGRTHVRRIHAGPWRLAAEMRLGEVPFAADVNTDDTKEEYNASEPINDRKRWLEQFIHLMGHTGNYTREEAIARIDKEGTLPDVLSFDPSKPAKYPNGRVFTDDVIDYRLAFLTKNECPPSGLKPHTDVLKEFPYLGMPHSK
jgi:hypothetical protein